MVLEIVLKRIKSLDVLAQPTAVIFQCTVDLVDQVLRVGCVVNDIERRNEIEDGVFRQWLLKRIAQPNVGQARLLQIRPRSR